MRYEYILVFKTSQDVIQHAKQYQKALICHKIAQYYKLKVAWGLGPICCKEFKCKCPRYKCKDAVHIRICGTYYDVVCEKYCVFGSQYVWSLATCEPCQVIFIIKRMKGSLPAEGMDTSHKCKRIFLKK